MKAGATAQAAGTLAVADAAAIGMVNQTVSATTRWWAKESLLRQRPGILGDADKQMLTDLPRRLRAQNCLINRGLRLQHRHQGGQSEASEERAAAVRVLHQFGRRPMRRIIAPAGYGAAHASYQRRPSGARAAAAWM
jgi:hypothetical protein